MFYNKNMDPVILFFILFVVVLIVSATLIYIWCCDRKNGSGCGGCCSTRSEGVYLVGRDGRDGLPGRDGVLVPDPSYAFLYVNNVVNENTQDLILSSSLSETVKNARKTKIFNDEKLKESREKILAYLSTKQQVNDAQTPGQEGEEIRTKDYLGTYPSFGNGFTTLFTLDGEEIPVGLPYSLLENGTFTSISYDVSESPERRILYEAGTLLKDFNIGVENIDPENTYYNELYIEYTGDQSKYFQITYSTNVTDESLGIVDPELPARSFGTKLFFKKRESGQPPTSETTIKGSDASMGSYPNEGPNPPATSVLSVHPAITDNYYSPFNEEIKHAITQTFVGNFWVSLSKGDVLKMHISAKPYYFIPEAFTTAWYGFVSLDNLRLSVKEIVKN